MTPAPWSSAGFDLTPTAPATGPFAGRDFLATWWELMAGDARLVIADDGAGLIAAGLHGETLHLVGDEDVTDYHSPRGRMTGDLVAQLAAAVPAGTPFRFDSLPAEAADALVPALLSHASDVAKGQHEIAAVLPLPGSFDDYLAAIGKKERHETRRKRRRFEAELGPPRLARVGGEDAVRSFANMHRLSSGDKGEFMTEAMEEFFLALHQRAGAVIDALLGDDGVPVAAAFGFEDAEAYYLYNSAYDPKAAHASPGVVLVSMLIENAIAAGRRAFDFLKGDEAYKFRLGAEPRPLYVLEGRFGGAG